MAFSWATFLTDALEMAPLAVAGVEQLIPAASADTKGQVATMSLNLATGLAKIATSQSPENQALVSLASQITAGLINELAPVPAPVQQLGVITTGMQATSGIAQTAATTGSVVAPK